MTKEDVSKLLKKYKNKRTYEKNKDLNTIYCEYCESDVLKYYYHIHIQTKKHQRLIEIRELEKNAPKKNI